MPASTLRKTALALALAAVLGTLGCSESVESLVASGEAALGKGDYRTAQIQLKSALQKDLGNVRARWLLGELSLAMEDGASAEKEIRRAGELGVGNDAVIPALAQALLLQGKFDALLELAQPPQLSPRARGEVLAAQGLVLLAKGEKGRADELTAEAVRLAPDSKVATTARIRMLIDADKLDEAEQLVVALQQKFPDYGLAWSLLGDVNESRGDLRKAEDAFSAAIAKRAFNAPDLLKRSYVRLKQQNLEAALADSQKLNNTLPNLQPAWFVTGLVHFQKKNYAQAKDALDRSYQLANDHVPTLVLLGWSNLNLGNVGQAVEQAGRALAIAPNLVAPRLVMATLYLRQAQPKQAETLVRPVVNGLPDNLAAKNLLATSLQAQGKGAEAASYLEQIATAKPESLDVQAAVGVELLRAREPEKALAVLGAAAERAPAAPLVNAAMITALIQEKKFDEAVAAAERFLEQNPNGPVALRLVASVHRAVGNRDQAKAAYRRLLEVVPGDPPGSVGLSEQLILDNDLAGARKVLEDAVRRHPNDAGLKVVLAELAIRDGRTADAKALLVNAAQNGSQHVAGRLLLGRLLLAENDPKGALEALPAGADVMDVDVLAARAEANFRLKEFGKSRDDLERLAAVKPPSAALQYQLATVYAALGEQGKRGESLDAAAALAPSDVTIGLEQARSLADRGRLAEASAAIDRLRLPETHPEKLKTELDVSAKKGDVAEQLRISEALFQVLPTTQTVLAVARAQAAAGQGSAAERTLRGWLDQHPDDDAVAIALAGVYGRSGREGEAVALLRPRAVRHPDNVLLLNNLAWYLREVAPSEGRALAEKARAMAPDDPNVLDTYAVVLARSRDFGRALLAIDQAIGLAADNVYLRLQRVEILRQSGDGQRAREELLDIEARGVPEPLRPFANSLAGRLAAGE